MGVFTDIDRDNMTSRMRKAVNRLSVTSWEDLATYRSAEILAIPNCGETTVRGMERSLALRGLRFADQSDRPGASRLRELEDEVIRLRGIIDGLAARVTEQSELLSRLAEKRAA